MALSEINEFTSANQWNPELYDSKHAFVWERGEELIALLMPSPGEAILDLGCGTGHLTSRIAASGARVVGIDNSAEMVKEARRNYPDLTFAVADARDFDPQHSFDAVFSNAVLHWVKEAGRVLDCVWNALKPGGRFVAELGGKGNVQMLLEAFRHARERIGAPLDASSSNPWYFPSIAKYTTLLEEHGFDVTFAELFERLTPLDDGAHGLRNWINMFGGPFCSALSAETRKQFIQESESLLRPMLFRDGTWLADYRRLRVVARKP
jgi:trans-aconitate methyltransferase